MALPTLPARLIALDLPRASEGSLAAVQARLLATARKRLAPTHPPSSIDLTEISDQEAFDELMGETFGREVQGYNDFARARHWAKTYMKARERAFAAINHLKPHEKALLLRAAHEGRLHGLVTRDIIEERIATLHAGFPWMARASTLAMNSLRHSTQAGAAPAHLPPMILLGPPGIAKSSWARALADAFDLRKVEIDIGASNGATFAIAGLERGWGPAAPGRVISAMLAQQTANPMVILDEIDKIPHQVGTSSGSLPSAFEALKSMMEPTTARAWVCPYHQIPFDLTRVSWVMTTNSIDQLPTAFLDRCRVVRVDGPDRAQLAAVARAQVAQRASEADQEILLGLALKLLEKRRRGQSALSLRQLTRIIQDAASYAERPRLH